MQCWHLTPDMPRARSVLSWPSFFDTAGRQQDFAVVGQRHHCELQVFLHVCLLHSQWCIKKPRKPPKLVFMVGGGHSCGAFHRRPLPPASGEAPGRILPQPSRISTFAHPQHPPSSTTIHSEKVPTKAEMWAQQLKPQNRLRVQSYGLHLGRTCVVCMVVDARATVQIKTCVQKQQKIGLAIVCIERACASRRNFPVHSWLTGPCWPVQIRTGP